MLDIPQDVISQQKEFWRLISTVAGTFTGLIIAGYSIFISRAEKAASDSVCRQYNFKECASVNSFYFILFALMMFTTPFLLAALTLVSLTHPINISYPALLSCGALIVILLIGFSIGGQFWYLFRVFMYNWKLDKYKGRRRFYSLFLLTLLLVFDLWVASILLNNIARILLVLDAFNSLGLWLKSKPYGDLFMPEAGVIFSLGAGIILIFFHLYIFQPERLLFKRDAETGSSLKKIKDQIEGECQSLTKIKESILFTINITKAKLAVEDNVQPKEVKDIFERMRVYADEQLQEEILNKKTVHIDSLEFCMNQKFITYDGITWLMKDINMYSEGLRRFESGFKEIPGQLYLLTELLAVTTVTNEQSRDKAIILVSDNRLESRSKLAKLVRRIFGR